MKTTHKVETIKKTNKDDEYTKITFKDYRGEYVVKLDQPRQLLEDLDKEVNYTQNSTIKNN